MGGILVIIGAAILSLIGGVICGFIVGLATSYDRYGEPREHSFYWFWVAVIVSVPVLFLILRALGNHFLL